MSPEHVLFEQLARLSARLSACCPSPARRGLIMDTELGNLVKADRFGFIKRAMHGTRMLSPSEVHGQECPAGLRRPQKASSKGPRLPFQTSSRGPRLPLQASSRGPRRRC